MDLGSIFHDFGSLQTFFLDFGQMSASIFALISQVAKNREELAKNPPGTSKEPHTNELLKT